MSQRMLQTGFLVLVAAASSIEAASYFSRLRTVIGSLFYWGGTVGVPVTVGASIGVKKGYEVYSTAKDAFIDNESRRYAKTGALAKEELQKLGMQDVRVVPCVGSAALINHIGVSYGMLEQVERSLTDIETAQKNKKQPESKDLERRDQFIGLLHSKAYEIREGYNAKRLGLAVGSAAIPVAVCRLVKAQQAISYPNAGKYLWGKINAAVSRFVYIAGNRFMEKNADFSSTDPHAIAGINSLRKEESTAFDKAFDTVYPEAHVRAKDAVKAICPSRYTLNGMTTGLEMVDACNNKRVSESTSKEK